MRHTLPNKCTKLGRTSGYIVDAISCLMKSVLTVLSLQSTFYPQSPDLSSQTPSISASEGWFSKKKLKSFFVFTSRQERYFRSKIAIIGIIQESNRNRNRFDTLRYYYRWILIPTVPLSLSVCLKEVFVPKLNHCLKKGSTFTVLLWKITI